MLDTLYRDIAAGRGFPRTSLTPERTRAQFLVRGAQA